MTMLLVKTFLSIAPFASTGPVIGSGRDWLTADWKIRRRQTGWCLTMVMLLVLILVLPVWAKPVPPPPVPPPPEKVESQPGPRELISIHLGTLPDYSRLVFTFSQPLDAYAAQRVEVDEFEIDFGTAQPRGQGRVELSDALVQGVAIGRENNRLLAKIKVKPSRFSFRHFTSDDRLSAFVDIRSFQAETAGSFSTAASGEKLEIPSPQAIANEIRNTLPRRPKPDIDKAVLAAAADLMIAGDFKAAAASLETLKTNFPQSPLLDPGLFLLADAYNQDQTQPLAEKFLTVVTAYQEAITAFPSSPQTPRAMLMQAQVYLGMEYISEAIGALKVLLKTFPQSREAMIANVMVGQVYIKLKKNQLAKAAFEAVLPYGPTGSFFLRAYYQLGRAYFQEGLFSQANEVFKEIVKQDESFYNREPDILYYMGVGYFHLGRMDLARAFLYHAFNLNPEQEHADEILARIGDTYKEENKETDAAKMYGLARKLFPDKPGALVSWMRLADAGAVSRLYSPGQLFRELESGADAATIKIYEDVINRNQDSPLVQLARFKLGSAYFKQGEYDRALEIIKQIIKIEPKGPLVKDARDLINKALVQGLRHYLDLKQYDSMVAVYTENSKLIDEDTQQEARHLLALAYAGLELPKEAAELWQKNEGRRENEDQRLLGLARSYMKLMRWPEAVTLLERFRQKFPEHKEAVASLLDQARAELAQDQIDPALNHLEQAVAADQKYGQDLDVQNQLSEIYIKKGETQKAAGALEKIIQILMERKGSPADLFLAYSRLGQAYAALDRKDEAVKSLEEALKIMPNRPYPDSLYLIAGTFKKLGLREKAEATLNVLMEKTTDAFWREAAQQELAALTPDDKITQLLKQPGLN